MEKFFERDGVMDANGHVCIMQMISVADTDADFFWEQLMDICDDEENLASIVEVLLSLYVRRKMKAIYWYFAKLKGHGIALPPYILTGAAFANLEVSLFYFGTFFLQLMWRMQETMKELGMEDFLYERMMA